jgi:hypothetical protein
MRIGSFSGDQDQGDDEAVECECFSEDEDQNEPYENPFLLRVGPNSRVPHNPDRIPCGLNPPNFTMQLNPQTSPEAMCENALLKV